MTNWASYIRRRPTLTSSALSGQPVRRIAPSQRRGASSSGRPLTSSALSRQPVRQLSPSGRPVVSSERLPLISTALSGQPVRQVSPSQRRVPSSAIPTNGALGLDFSSITSQFEGTGKEITDKIQSFLPTAFKLLLVFIGIKVLLWFLGRRR